MLAEDTSAEIAGPATADWETKADPAEVANLFSNFASEIKAAPPPVATTNSSSSGITVDYVPPPPPPPVKVKFEKMSRDGIIDMKFNQPLRVPRFLDQQNDERGRTLISLKDLDVSRDIVQVQFVSRNDEEGVSKEFFLELTEWTPNNLAIKVNFTDPLSVSQGDSEDQLICKIKNPQIFVPVAEGGEPLSAKSATMVKEVPKQLPKGYSAKELEEQAESTASAMKTIAIVQLVASIFMKGAINDLLGLYYTLQIVVYMQAYDTPTPSNTEIYNQ